MLHAPLHMYMTCIGNSGDIPCLNGALRVYDGNQEDDAHLLQTLCAWRASEYVISSGREVFVVLDELQVRGDERIHLKYQAFRKHLFFQDHKISTILCLTVKLGNDFS